MSKWLVLTLLFCNSYSYAISTVTDLPVYPSNKLIDCKSYIPAADVGRDRDERHFREIYGRNQATVRSHLVEVYWMPKYFGHRYPLFITGVNNVNLKLTTVSNQLEALVEHHPDYLKYLDKPSGAFYWRHIQHSNRRSPHSFGIAIDLNTEHSNYWIWDSGIKTNHLNQKDKIVYTNSIPCDIVSIFENNGFIWGGKWLHYDTMHFEYRPELLES
jgi:peptidoglycan L-alanyl-D-glutamate endopeptidase CwlK